MSTSKFTQNDTGPRQCIFWNDPHVWVQHRHECSYDHAEEKYGCTLPDFATRYGTVSGKEVHWVGGDWDQKAFMYMDTPSGGRCSSDYGMPDYCSRAIISELSTVYDGVHRTPSLIAGAKVLFTTKYEQCSTARLFSSAGSTYEGLLDETPTAKACWGLGQDWRQMWCAKYDRCQCTHGQDCESEDKIQCCRDMYQLFLDGNPKHSRRLPMQTAETLFSIEVKKQQRKGLFSEWSSRWLRVASRSEASGTLPKVFLEYGHGSKTFHGAATFDLCKEHTISVVSEVEFVIAQSGHKHPDYHFRISIDSQFGPGTLSSANLPKTAADVVQLVEKVARENCLR